MIPVWGKSRSTTKYRWWMMAAIAAMLVFLSSSFSSWSGRYPWLAPLGYPVVGLEYLWSRASSALFEGWDRYVFLVGTEDRNKELIREKIELESELALYKARSTAVDELRKTLGFTQSLSGDFLTSQVISRGSGAGFEVIRLNRGSRSGVEVGMMVLSRHGLVGHVLRVAGFYSDVLPLTSPEGRVDIRLERTRLRGVLAGTGGGYLGWFPRQRRDIRIGDVALTSGLIPGYQGGFPVAEVVKITYGLDDASQKVVLKPFQDLQRLDYLVILLGGVQVLSKDVDTSDQ